MSRKQLSVRTRFEVFKRDRFTCQYCGRTPPDVILHVDHIIAVADGGENDPTNLTTACADCNLGKGARPLTAVPLSLEEQAADAEERRQQIEAHAEMLQADREQFEEWCWEVAETLQPGASKGYNQHNFRSITMFVRRLGFGETREAAQIASDRWHVGGKRFKYFCGVCWRKIREREGGDE